jgi:SM-20-related protein
MDKQLNSSQLLHTEKLHQVLHELEAKQWCVVDSLFSLDLSKNIQRDILSLDEQNKLVPANIGRNDGKKVISSIRGDRIFWLDEEKTELNDCQKKIFATLDQLKTVFNHNFYLNLKKFEFHYALYSPGSHYDKHIDQHKGRNQRIITLVHYLNSDWEAKLGGRLLVYDPSEENKLMLSVEPIFGRTMLFFSDVFPHEVELSLQTRLSLTGWFRND